MAKRFITRKNNLQIAVYLLMLLAVIYFSYHLVNGNRGLITLLRLRQELHNVSTELAALQHEKQILEQKNRSMHPQHLDLDYLDEIARKELGLIASSEMLVILQEN